VESKFRAWDEKRKTMMQPIYTNRIPEGVRKRDFFIGFNSTGLEVSEYEGKGLWRKFPVMQSTGRKDSNGKDAYHKDIVSANGYSNWIVERHDDGWMLKQHDTDNYQKIPKDFVIIGNTHEHQGILGVTT